MDLYYKQEVTVGVLVLAAIIIFVVGLMWLTRQSLGGAGEATVLVRFESVKGLTEGDPVQISGVDVGRVSRVALEGVDSVLVVLAVEGQRRPRADATAAVASLDFLGSRYVEYNPGTSPDMLTDGEVIDGERESDLSVTATAIGDRASEFLLRSQEVLVDDVRPTLKAVERSLDVLARIGEGPLVDDLGTSLQQLNSVGARLDTILANPAIDESISQMDEIAESLKEMAEGLATTTQALGQILEKIDSDEGTLGRLVNDPAIADDLQAVLAEMKLLLEDLRERPGRYLPRNFKVFE
jgi:phospholipid/cholesterol/gamma-HCH transport system substrate-binding protein